MPNANDDTTTERTDTVPELRLTAAAVAELRDHLLQDDDKERIAFGYCTRSGPDFLLDELAFVPNDDHAVSTTGACRAADTVERDHVTACASTDRHLLIIHSHPFAQHAAFSETDADIITRFRDWLQPLYPDVHLLFGVLGQDNLRVECLTADTDTDTDSDRVTVPVRVLGDWTLDRPIETEHATPAATVDWKRYDRNIRAIGLDGQQRLADTHIAVVGCGGIGSYVATGLARLGVRELTLVDPDDIEESNLPRLNGARPGDVGQPKVHVMQELCWTANPGADITAVYDRVQDAADTLRDADLVVAGVDRLTPRHWLNEFCTRHLIPYIDIGTVIGLDDDAAADTVATEEAFLQTIVPGVTGCFDCLDRGSTDRLRLEHQDDAEQLADLEAGYISGTDLTPEAAVLPLNLNAVAAALNTVVDLVAGRRPPVDFLRLEQVSQDRVPMQTQRTASCVTCGDNGVLAAGETQPVTLPAPETAAVADQLADHDDPLFAESSADLEPAVTRVSSDSEE